MRSSVNSKGFLGLDKMPLFPTGVAARITGLNTKTIINYDNAGLLNIERSDNGRRLYSRNDLFLILLIKQLIDDKNLTFAGVKCVVDILMKLSDDSDVLTLVLSKSQQRKLLDKVLV